MSKYINTNAIILKRITYRDADRILTLYTKELGKVSVIAKGVRKMNSKRKSSLELLNFIDIQLIENHEWYIAGQTEIIQSFPKIKSDLIKTNQAYYIAEVFEKIMAEQEKDELLFSFLCKTLITMNDSYNPNIINAFNLKILKLGGFYSRVEHKIMNTDLKDYLHKLERLKYEETDNLEINQALIENTHKFLRGLTEEILEQNIKSEVYWE